MLTRKLEQTKSRVLLQFFNNRHHQVCIINKQINNK